MTYPLLAYVYGASTLVPAVAGLSRFRVLQRPLRILAVLSVLACFTEVIEYLVARWNHYNAFISSYYEFFEYSMLLGVYFTSVGKKRTRAIIIALELIFAVVWLIEVPTFYNPRAVTADVQTVSRILLIVASLVILQSILDQSSNRLMDLALFWVASGVILYSTGTLMVFSLANRLLKLGLPYFEMAWRINWLLSITANLFYVRAFLCKQHS